MRKPQTSPVRDVILVATIESMKTNPVGMTQMNVAEMMNENEKLYTTARFDLMLKHLKRHVLKCHPERSLHSHIDCTNGMGFAS